MTVKDFQNMAEYMGATVVFKTSTTAVFDGPKFCVTIEVKQDQLENTYPVELSSLMASAAMLN